MASAPIRGIARTDDRIVIGWGADVGDVNLVFFAVDGGSDGENEVVVDGHLSSGRSLRALFIPATGRPTILEVGPRGRQVPLRTRLSERPRALRADGARPLADEAYFFVGADSGRVFRFRGDQDACPATDPGFDPPPLRVGQDVALHLDAAGQPAGFRFGVESLAPSELQLWAADGLPDCGDPVPEIALPGTAAPNTFHVAAGRDVTWSKVGVGGGAAMVQTTASATSLMADSDGSISGDGDWVWVPSIGSGLRRCNRELDDCVPLALPRLSIGDVFDVERIPGAELLLTHTIDGDLHLTCVDPSLLGI
jgi:hypothetical protein